MVGVESPLSVSELSGEVEGSGEMGGEAATTRGPPCPESMEARAARLGSPLSSPGSGRAGRVGAGVASPEQVSDSADSEIGMSVTRSGSRSGGAEKRSEKPPPDLGAGAGGEP